MRLLLAAAGAAALAGLAACSLGDGDGDQSSSATRSPSQASAAPSVALTPCTAATCTGEIDGAEYEIQLPKAWNGTLLLYSHGYVEAQPVAPNYATPSLQAAAAPDDDVADELLSQGYALAGSSYSRLGFAVPEGVAAGEALYSYFARTIGIPHRVYLWGSSMGALITQELAEKGLPWVSATAPMCGPVAGMDQTLDLSLDVAYAVKTLLAPKLQLTGFASHQAAVRAWVYAQQSLYTAASGYTSGDRAEPAKVLLISALADGPDQSWKSDGSAPDARLGVAVDFALDQMYLNTDVRYDIEKHVGGNPSSNSRVDYSDRISAAERQYIDRAAGAGTTNRLLARLATGKRVSSEPAPRARTAKLFGEPSGALRVPTVALHTAKDPIALVQGERLFAQRARRAGGQGQLCSCTPSRRRPSPRSRRRTEVPDTAASPRSSSPPPSPC